MSQKLTNDQLREAYFKNHTTLKSFGARQELPREPQKPQISTENKRISYEKFNDNEINRFGNLFNTFVDRDPKTPIITLDTTSQEFEFEPEPEQPVAMTTTSQYNGLYQDLYRLSSFEELQPVVSKEEPPQVSRLENDLRAQMQAQEELIREMREQLELTAFLTAEMTQPAPTEYVLTDEDDLYLENLVNGNGNQSVAPSSLADILAEITDNEKDSVSNYESSIFDANVEQLFAEGENIDKTPSFSVPPIPTPPPILDTPVAELSFESEPTPIIEPTEAPELNFAIEDLAEIDFELPPMPDLTVVPAAPVLDLLNIEPEVPTVELEPLIPAFELPLVPTVELEPLLPDFDLPPLPEMTATATVPDFDLPPLPELEFLNEQPAFNITNNSDKIDTKIDKSEQKKKQREKDWKLRILDGLLIIVLLAIVGVLAFHFLQTG